MEGPVFISYSSKDVALANKIVAYLEQQGYPCWIAPRNIASGYDYTDMINDAIQDCRAVVLIVSEKAVQSQWVKKELSTAVSYNKPILPFRISHVELTGGLQFLLNNVQWIDASNNPTGKFDQIVDGLNQRLPDNNPTPSSRRWPRIVVAIVTLAVLVAGGYWLLTRGHRSEPTVVTEEDTIIPAAAEPAVSVVEEINASIGNNTQTKKEKTKKEVVTSKVVVEEPVAEPEPKVEEIEAEQPKAIVPDTAGQAQARKAAAQAAAQAAAKEQAFQKKLRLAKNLYIDHKYREALNLFDELRREKPTDREINAYIIECKKNIL